MNMRTASYLGKITGHSYLAAPAAEVFTAATLGAAISLGRDDLGRLMPGALADIILIDLSGRNTLRWRYAAAAACSRHSAKSRTITQGTLASQRVRSHSSAGLRATAVAISSANLARSGKPIERWLQWNRELGARKLARESREASTPRKKVPPPRRYSHRVASFARSR